MELKLSEDQVRHGRFRPPAWQYHDHLASDWLAMHPLIAENASLKAEVERLRSVITNVLAAWNGTTTAISLGAAIKDAEAALQAKEGGRS